MAPGPGWGRHLLVRDDGAPCRRVRGEGRDQRELRRELRSRWRTRRRQHRLHRPGGQREGHLHLQRGVTRPHGRRRQPDGSPGRALPLRSGEEGLPRHRPQHDLEGLVHGRERRAQRRLLPDDRQHERRDAPVRRHRRVDVHRPADARHDLHGGGEARLGRHGVHRHGDGEERQVPDRDRVRHGSGPEHGADGGQVPADVTRLPAVRPLRRDGQRQRGRRAGQRRGGLGDDRRLDRTSRARLVRSGHRDERGEPRLRAARPCRPRRQALRSDERLRRRCWRRPRPAGRRPRDHEPNGRGAQRQRRPDGPRGARGRQGRPRARLRRLPGGGGRNGRGLARGRLRRDACRLREGLEGLRQAAEDAADGEAARHHGRRQEAARGRVLPQRQRDQGVRGQDVPGRHRGQPRLPVGPGRLSRRSGEHVLRLLP